MTYNVLSKEFKTQLRKSLHEENGQVSPVSVIIDETTDKGTTKCMAIVIKLFDEEAKRVDTRLLNLVQSVTKYVDRLGRDFNKSPHPPYSMLLDEN